MTLSTTQLQTFPLAHFKYVHVKTIFQTAVSLSITFHAHGETFQVSVVAVGQNDRNIPSQVVSIIDQGLSPGDPPDLQHLQQANNTYTKLNYTVVTVSECGHR